MSASRTHAFIGTTLAYTSDIQWDRHGVRRHGVRRHGVRRRFKTRLHRVVFCRAGGENKRRLLARRAAHAEVTASRQILANEFLFQQDSAPAHRAREKNWAL